MTTPQIGAPTLQERLRVDVFYGEERMHKMSKHNPLHMEAADAIDAQEATIAALVEALTRIEDLTCHNMPMSAKDEQCVNREARAALAKAAALK